ncbi:hypothetical protein HNV10_06555 [Winogradskyella litoriviva]|uniref:Yip1 domain-containing protein n=1 Tax=Winogradskyella litoriviva TaxID=1220182 RepID=A0ABX2E532_9FLAO|nr:hypothetical protein [Winogradskyella litoriviva]NRD22894.1 hypothetical protein [Winogradskyella litoriviva]
MTEYTDYYKTLSLSQLYKIIEESEKYNPIAVKTAEQEINHRQNNEANFNDTKSIIEDQKKQNDTRLRNKKNQEEKLKQGAFTFLETISPIQNGIQTPERIIRLITILFGIIAVFKIYDDFWFLQFMLTDGLDNWDLSMLLYLVELIILPITVILFWQRKKTGWILLALLLTSTAVSAINHFLSSINRKPSDFSGIDNLFPEISPMAYVTAFLFCSTSLWLICKKSVSSIFKVSEQTVFLAVSLTIIAQLIIILFIT